MGETNEAIDKHYEASLEIVMKYLAVFTAFFIVGGILIVGADDIRTPSPVEKQNRDGGLTHPCAAALCGPNTTCEAVIPECNEPLGIGCNFKPQAECRAICRKGNDALQCKRGQHLMYDIQGCKACYSHEGFVNPCEKTKCADDETCVLQEVICKKYPCHPMAECRKKKKACPVLIDQIREECPKNCFKVINSDGCEFCKCCNGCVNYQCPKGTECTLETMFCIRGSCPDVVRCREV